MTRPWLEWQSFDAASDAEWCQQTQSVPRTEQHGSGTPQATARERRKMRYLYELICAVALLYAAAAYILWQQVDARVAGIDQQVNGLREEMAAFQPERTEELADTPEEPADAPAFETAYLHFTASPNAVDVAKAVAPRMDALFEQFHRDFGLPLPEPGEKFKIVVDSAAHARGPFSDAHSLSVIHPKLAANRHGISEAEALATELSVQLAMQLIGRAINSREIKPQWRSMTLALQTVVQLENGFDDKWQQDRSLLPHRHEAQSRPIKTVHLMTNETDGQPDQETFVHPTAYATANPLAEFILVTYGYEKVPDLLDAFGEHDTWETLAPDLFHLPASEFQAQWHDWLREQYPIPTQPETR